MHLPVPHSASHKHFLDYFSRAVLPCIHLHWSLLATVLPPLFWEFSGEGDWSSDHAGFVVGSKWHLVRKDKLTRNQGWEQSVRFFICWPNGIGARRKLSRWWCMSLAWKVFAQGSCCCKGIHTSRRDDKGPFVTLWVGFTGELLK